MSYDLDGEASYAVGPQPDNWNLHSMAASASYLTLEQVLAQVWPSAFDVGPSGVAALDTSLLTSAQQISAAPQTIVYQINPRAVWSDGTPITYRDFAYNWEAQSGRAKYSDVGGVAFTPADKVGYDDIASVEGSPADPYMVTVIFSSPFPAWRSLFAYLVPAHIGRAVGFDSGFTDPVSDLVSGGPYIVSQLQDGYSLQLVRNARYWGSPANLSSVTYYFTESTAQVLDALAARQLDVATVQAPASEYQQLQATRGLSVQAVASATYEDLDFNEAVGPLKKEVLRQAIMMSIDRAGMASSSLGQYGLAAKPVDNRALLPGEPGYFADGAAFDQPAPAAALQLLTSSGYTQAGGTLETPGGKPVALSLFVSSEDPEASQLGEEVESSCAAIGIKVSIVTGDVAAGDVLGSATAVPPPAGWEMAIELRQIPAFPSAIAQRYVSRGPANVDDYSSAAMDTLLAQIPTSSEVGRAALYDQVDAQAWTDAVDLPLVAVPVIVATNRQLLNVEPGPYYGNIVWNEQDWGYQA